MLLKFKHARFLLSIKRATGSFSWLCERLSYSCIYIQCKFNGLKMKTRSAYLNYIADYMLTRQYSLRTINAYLSWVQTLFTFTINLNNHIRRTQNLKITPIRSKRVIHSDHFCEWHPISNSNFWTCKGAPQSILTTFIITLIEGGQFDIYWRRTNLIFL